MKSTSILRVELGGERHYPIYIAPGLLEETALLVPYIKSHQALIVTNETVAPLYLEKTLRLFPKMKVETATVILPDGEEYKTLDGLKPIFDTLLARKFDRSCTLVALGGGVVGDMTGFAAACYQRGVPFIQIPTTLLAQVDSSVGGKTGVNHPLGKNMLGAFYQPQCVVIDTDTLQTLDSRQFCAGLAEVIKYGLINDAKFFSWLEENIQAVLAHEQQALQFIINRCCANKSRIVAQDERETTGIRALLNLGHTFGHAIETGTGYGTYLHGEAVAIGLCLSAHLSARLGWLPAVAVERIVKLVEKMHLPTMLPESLMPDHTLALMQVDKKVRDGKIRLVLLRDIGQAVVTDEYPPALLKQILIENQVGDIA
ncbi:MAG: 3-dehydroquinate synthase [Beggiatoa sp. IS2]|nr:MAG: 3-dehydroquinate synthase [Beggiatoa sp. IS2]